MDKVLVTSGQVGYQDVWSSQDIDSSAHLEIFNLDEGTFPSY